MPHLFSELAGAEVSVHGSDLLSLWKHVRVLAKKCTPQSSESIEHRPGVGDDLAL